MSVCDINGDNGEIIYRKMTNDELEQQKLRLEKIELLTAQRQAIFNAKQSALEKLKTLGFSDEEIKALVG